MKTPYWYQDKAVRSIYSYFDLYRGNPLIGLPTGTGKGFVIALFIKSVLDQWPDQRIVCSTHVKELISQNYEELTELWPTAPAGICSAGLGSFDTLLSVIFGGVQTMVSRIEMLGHRDLLIIDEAHLLSPADETRYQKLIAGLRAINPYMRVVGLSATLWRMGQGHLTQDGIFTDVAFDMTNYEGFNRLLAEGFMVPLTTPSRLPDGSGITQYDMNNVHVRGWNFNEVEAEQVINVDKLNVRICEEQVWLAQGRQCCLTFCNSIAHAEQVTYILQHIGQDAQCVHSKKEAKENDRIISAWKSGQLRWIVNKDKLTTGVNNRRIDFIGWMRALVSSSLWVQGNGRGTRTHPESSKRDCLVADFAGNTLRLGPINDPVLPSKPGKGGTGTVPIRICMACGEYNHAAARACTRCGAIFERDSHIHQGASSADIIKTDEPKYEVFNVNRIIYKRHIKTGRPACLELTYYVGNARRSFTHYLFPEHGAQARREYENWFSQRFVQFIVPSNTEAALAVLQSQTPRTLEKRIKVHINQRYPKIVDWEF